MRTFLAVAAICFVLAAPAATAHTSIFSADDRVRASAGLLNEPTSTYSPTGLDLCFTQNNTARTPITGASLNPGALTVVLKAPTGETHTSALSVPFGRSNCVVFETPLVLTTPGQYLLDISGEINGTSFSETNVKAGGAVRDRATITFPHGNVMADHEAQARILQMESNMTAMMARMHDMDSEKDDGGNFAPTVVPAILVMGLAGLVAFLRRR